MLSKQHVGGGGGGCWGVGDISDECWVRMGVEKQLYVCDKSTMRSAQMPIFLCLWQHLLKPEIC